MAATTAHKGFAGLTAQQQERHRELLHAFGFDLNETLDTHISTAKLKGPVLISADLHYTVLHPRIIVVKNVAMMKKFGGVPDAVFDAGSLNDDHIHYPPEWNSRYNRLIDKADSHQHLVQILADEQRVNIRKALHAYLMGHSKQVASYETMINAIHFPQYAATFAANTLCVAAGTVVKIGPPQPPADGRPTNDQDPYVVNFASVCIEDTGSIQFTGPTQLNVSGLFQRVTAGQCGC